MLLHYRGTGFKQVFKHGAVKHLYSKMKMAQYECFKFHLSDIEILHSKWSHLALPHHVL